MKITEVMKKEKLLIITGDSSMTSGVAILHKVLKESKSMLSKKRARQKYRAFQTLAKCPNESLSAYTARTIRAAKELENTKLAVSDLDRNELWRQGLGPEFEDLNFSIDIQGIVPPGWEEDQDLSDLLGMAESYLLDHQNLLQKT